MQLSTLGSSCLRHDAAVMPDAVSQASRRASTQTRKTPGAHAEEEAADDAQAEAELGRDRHWRLAPPGE